MSHSFAPPFLLPEPIAAVWLCAKVTLLFTVAWGVARAMPRSSAAVRHQVWTLALTGALALVILTPIVPRIRVDVATGAIALQPAPALRSARAGDGSRMPGPPASPQSLTLPLGWSSTVWLVGVRVLALRLGVSALRLSRLARTARPPSPELRAAWAAAGLRSEPAPRARLLLSDRIAAPVTWGSLRPLILLPASAVRWPSARVCAAIAHETAHVRRLDHFVQSFGRAVCLLFWFHPLAWFAYRRLRALSERAADDRALLTGIPPREYAAHLLAVARTAWSRPELADGLSMVRRSEFEQRIVAILEPTRPRPMPGRRTRTLLVLAYLLALVPLAAVRVHLGGAVGAPPTIHLLRIATPGHPRSCRAAGGMAHALRA